MNHFHLLNATVNPPERFTYPFNYTPHPLCVMAADILQKYIARGEEWREEIERGKMFGVLVVRDEYGRIGFLAAYSGLLAGRNDWQYFVPPVYDSQQPDGYFKTHEREISLINDEIIHMERDEKLVSLRDELHCAEALAEKEVEDYRKVMAEAKRRRDALREAPEPLTPQQNDAMIRESQFQKAELKRIKKKNLGLIGEKKIALAKFEGEISALKKHRKELSDSLQHWLFSQYDMLNANGEHRNLCTVFADTPQGVPPSGAGDCCAPKLLQYAFKNNFHPLCMAEFWWGKSPKSEIRHHLHYYPACRSKCKPILRFMLQGLDVDPDPHDKELTGETLRILYQDKDIVVVSKPSGMLSMPGLVGRISVVEALRIELGGGYYVPAHRLDMDTSGLLVVARSDSALRSLHELFAGRKVVKRYSAILDGVPATPRHGVIRLPLLPSETDRPRQVVDCKNGKPSITEYDIQQVLDGKTLVRLFPHTGRTHQLRVHCAHADGLATPIVGDKLYGHPSVSRLMLHAGYLSFVHPSTGKRLSFSDDAHFAL